MPKQKYKKQTVDSYEIKISASSAKFANENPVFFKIGRKNNKNFAEEVGLKPSFELGKESTISFTVKISASKFAKGALYKASLINGKIRFEEIERLPLKKIDFNLI